MKKIISSWIGIFVGCTILAAGFVYFIKKDKLGDKALIYNE